MQFTYKLGKALLYEMKQHSKTIEEVADFANFTIYDLCRVITAQLYVNPKDLNMLCYAIGIDAKQFLDNINNDYYKKKGVY